MGTATKTKLNRYKIYTIGDLAQQDEKFLNMKLGKWGVYLHDFAMGMDESPVRKTFAEEAVKSIGNSITHYKDMETEDEVRSVIYLLAESVAERLRESGLGRAKRISIVARNSDLTVLGKRAALKYPTKLSSEIAEKAFEIFKTVYKDKFSLRGIGISVFDFTLGSNQLSIDYAMNKSDKKEDLEESVDKIRKKYGRNSIQKAIIFKDKRLRKLDIKEEHVIHPESFFNK